MAIPNPFKQLREQNRWSIEQVASAANVNKDVVLRLEQALHNSIPPKLLDFYLRRCDEDVSALRYRYRAFQLQTREETGPVLMTDLGFVRSNPFVYIRERVGWSRIELCKKLCVHPALVHKVEMQPHLARKMPGAYLLALKESGHSLGFITQLERAFDEFKERELTKS